MSYGYGRDNSYDQRGGPAQPGYGASSSRYGGYNNAQTMGRDDYDGTDVEMEPLTGNGGAFPRGPNPKAIFNEISLIRKELARIRDLSQSLEPLENAVLYNPDSSDSSKRKNLDELNSQITAACRELASRIANVKQNPGANASYIETHIPGITQELKELNQKRLINEREYSAKSRDQAARQYRIVNPNATDAEIEEAIQNPNDSIFTQAMMQSDRRGQANSVKREVELRHAAIMKVNQDIAELGALFEDLANLVVQQEAAVTNIEMKGEEVVENLDKGTEQIGVAIKSARNARKWKWWCLGIVVLIIIIIVVVVLIYKFVIQTPVKTTAKRFVLPDFLPPVKLSTPGHAAIPGQDFTPATGDKIVTTGSEYVQGLRKFRRFQG